MGLMNFTKFTEEYISDYKTAFTKEFQNALNDNRTFRDTIKHIIQYYNVVDSSEKEAVLRSVVNDFSSKFTIK